MIRLASQSRQTRSIPVDQCVSPPRQPVMSNFGDMPREGGSVSNIENPPINPLFNTAAIPNLYPSAAPHQKTPSLYSTSIIPSPFDSSFPAPVPAAKEEMVQVTLPNGENVLVSRKAIVQASGSVPPPCPSRPFATNALVSRAQPSQNPSRQNNGNLKVDANTIFTRLSNLVSANNLHAFYDQKKIWEMANHIAFHVDFDNFCKSSQLSSVEEALEYTALALYNIVFLVDNSISMTYKGRIDEMKRLVSEATEIAVLFDTDGLDVKVFNQNNGGSNGGENLKTIAQVEDMIKGIKYTGGTPIGRSITELHHKMLVPNVQRNSLQKPLFVVIVTDGEPDNENEVFGAIRAGISYLRQTKYGDKACTYQFVQVGNDSSATAFLDSLDNHSDIGHVVDHTGNIETEEKQHIKKCREKGITPFPYSFPLWMQKLLLGAIDPIFDTLD